MIQTINFKWPQRHVLFFRSVPRGGATTRSGGDVAVSSVLWWRRLATTYQISQHASPPSFFPLGKSSPPAEEKVDFLGRALPHKQLRLCGCGRGRSQQKIQTLVAWFGVRAMQIIVQNLSRYQIGGNRCQHPSDQGPQLRNGSDLPWGKVSPEFNSPSIQAFFEAHTFQFLYAASTALPSGSFKHVS